MRWLLGMMLFVGAVVAAPAGVGASTYDDGVWHGQGYSLVSCEVYAGDNPITPAPGEFLWVFRLTNYEGSAFTLHFGGADTYTAEGVEDAPGVLLFYIVTPWGADPAGTYVSPSDGELVLSHCEESFTADVGLSATNLAGDDHSFTVTSTFNDGTGLQPVPDGSTVGFTWTGDGAVTAPSAGATSCTTTGGSCTVTVNSATPGSGTITIDSVTATINGDTYTDVGVVAAPGGSLTATKTWEALPDPSRTVVRLSGPDRFATAVAVSQHTFGEGVPVVYLATGAQFADALAAGPVASGAGPILLVPPDAIPAVTANELERLAPERIVVLGGPSAVSDDVLQAAGSFTAGPVTRVAGADRYETAAKLSAESTQPGIPVVYVASGVGFADALAAGPIAAGSSILLVRPDTVPDATAAELTRLEPGRIVVLGGPSAISDNVVAALGEFTTGTVTRLSGPDRFATSVAISQAGFGPGVDAVFLATGAQFPDALAAGAASNGAVPILLTRQDCVPQLVLDEIDRLDPAEVRVLGGPAAVGPEAYDLTACGLAP